MMMFSGVSTGIAVVLPETYAPVLLLKKVSPRSRHLSRFLQQFFDSRQGGSEKRIQKGTRSCTRNMKGKTGLGMAS